MGNERREIFIKVLERVLEQLAFMFGEAVEKEELIIEGEKYLHVTMGFKGLQSGNLGIAVPAEMSAALASNILGVDKIEEIAPEKSVDALKELLNVFCGQLLTTIYGEEPVFDLTVPEMAEVSKADWKELLDNPDAVGMMIEDVPLIAHASF